tara:strand:- start:134 stop:511 length:378 start_codon:yes stop_codon:yes gene_type:complete
MKKTPVVVAVIKKENLYLIVKRNKHKHLGLKWEFPGGKVEINESFEQALSREIKEELNVEIDIVNKIAEENYNDNKINVILYYYLCRIKEGDIFLSEHEDYAWVEKKDFLTYDFLEGDREIFYLL